MPPPAWTILAASQQRQASVKNDSMFLSFLSWAPPPFPFDCLWFFQGWDREGRVQTSTKCHGLALGFSGFGCYSKLTPSWRGIFMDLWNSSPWTHPSEFRECDMGNALSVLQQAIFIVSSATEHTVAHSLQPWESHITLFCASLVQNLKWLQAGSFLYSHRLASEKQPMLASSPRCIYDWRNNTFSAAKSVTSASFPVADFSPVLWGPGGKQKVASSLSPWAMGGQGPSMQTLSKDIVSSRLTKTWAKGHKIGFNHLFLHVNAWAVDTPLWNGRALRSVFSIFYAPYQKPR